MLYPNISLVATLLYHKPNSSSLLRFLSMSRILSLRISAGILSFIPANQMPCVAPLVCHRLSNGKARSEPRPVPLLLSPNYYVATVKSSRLNRTSSPPQSTGGCNIIIQQINPSLLAIIHDCTSFCSIPTTHVRVFSSKPHFSHFTATAAFSFPISTLLIPFVSLLFFSAPSPQAANLLPRAT